MRESREILRRPGIESSGSDVGTFSPSDSLNAIGLIQDKNSLHAGMRNPGKGNNTKVSNGTCGRTVEQHRIMHVEHTQKYKLAPILIK